MSRDIIQSISFNKTEDGSFDVRGIEKMLEEEYLKRVRENKDTTKKSFSPSTVGYGHGNCPRYWNIAFNGAYFVETTDALGVANMANGSQAHERIQSLFESSGTLVNKETEITLKDPPVRGFIDVMIRWQGEVIVGEIKTTREEVFMFRKASMKPAPYHLLQILIYMKATGKNKGFLLYENKNTQEFLVIPVQMDEKNKEILDYAINWMREVYSAYENNTMPKQPFQKRNKICKECPVFETCWNSELGWDIEIPKLEVPRP